MNRRFRDGILLTDNDLESETIIELGEIKSILCETKVNYILMVNESMNKPSLGNKTGLEQRYIVKYRFT